MSEMDYEIWRTVLRGPKGAKQQVNLCMGIGAGIQLWKRWLGALAGVGRRTSG